MTTAAKLNFRPPSTSSTTATDFAEPTIDFLSGRWHVTHSTLPMWKNNRNVVITYTPLSSGDIDDLVEYSPLTSDKLKTVRGIDKPDATVPSAWNWRGKGLLKIASSHWEVLGHGDDDGGWVVTFFEKTLFTPAGIDVYARRKGGLSAEVIEQIRGEMKAINDPEFQKQADQIFEIKHDWSES